MECNKDDAVKATDLAEKKCMLRDFTAAKKFCVKALQLYPSLERAKQMLAVVEVQAAAAAAQLGVEDWYGILQVDPFADFPTIKKQYRKMALMLHPDKNRLEGAEPAFKLLNEAWMVLSDKEKKTIYDVKRSARMKRQENGRYNDQPSCSTQTDVHSAAAAATATTATTTTTYTTATAAPAAAAAAAAAPPPPPPPPPPPTANSQPTFWTQCPSCKIQYQYYRKFENYQLLCHRCQTGFVATDIGTPPVESSQWPGQKPKKKATNGASQNGVNGESSAFQQMQQRAREREERRREEERRRAEREREREEKRRLKEALKKAKEEERRREALEKQMNKLREREEREARKKNMEAIKKKLKRHRMEEEEDDDDDDDDDEDSDEARIGEESNVPPEILRFGLRRSNRARKNVTYRDDDFDDEDDGPPNRKARIEESEMDKLSPDEVLLKQELAERGRQHILEALRAMREASRIPTGSCNPAERSVEPCVVPETSMPTEKSLEAANNIPVFSVIQGANPMETSTSLGDKELDAAKKVAEDFRKCEDGAQIKSNHFADQYHYHQQQQKQEEQQQQQQGQKQQLQQQQEEVSVRVEPSQDENQTEDDVGDEEESQFLVPDTDFYNFDTDRRESSVREGQVWALYDDTDGMPRFYCEIKQLVSLNPFKVRLRWLERYAGSDEALEWEAGGFAVTCGQFKCKRRTETEIHFNKFSHLMEVDRIHANVVSVFPRRGEVWAIYKDWRLELRPSDVTYEMVEVIESDLEVAGVKVLLLRKVDGFKTIFARGDETRTLWCKDLMRFSHKVPAHWMKGTEKENAPQNCWELDTAATPSHLIYRR